jgi:hypothetical protein
MRNTFDYAILDAINNAFKTIKASPLILGGVSSSGGGAGGPPGGIIGLLPQYRVAYDTDEFAMSGFVQPGAFDEDGDLVSGSLLDNLNHIRWRIQELELGSGGGGGASTFLDLTDTPNDYSTFSGYIVAVKGTEDGLEFIPSVGGGGTPGGSDTEIQFNDGGSFGGDSEFVWDKVDKVLGIGDPSILPNITPDHAFWITGDGVSPSQFMSGYGSGIAPYMTFMKADGSGASPTNIKNNMVIGRIRGRGYEGSNWTDTRMEIRFVADGDWSTGDTPTRIEIYTVPDGSATMSLVMTLRSDGNVNIGSGKQYLVNGSQHTHTEKEDVSNKATTIDGNEADTAKYPSTSAVYDFALERDDNFQTVIGEQVSIADDATYSFTPPTTAGMILVQSRSAASTNYVLGFYVTTAGGSIQSYVLGSNTELLTGVMPSPTAGTDTKFCVSVDTSGGVIYIRNRTGSTRNVVIKCW